MIEILVRPKRIVRAVLPQRVVTLWRLKKNAKKSGRMLEIGPGPQRIPGFETLSIIKGGPVDYVWDAAKRLPFSDNVFEIVYASHVLEHIPWIQSEEVIREWVRILKPGGWLEVWVPDAVKICKAFVDYELYDRNCIDKDGWYKSNAEKDPCKWASGRIYAYGDGTGDPNHPNWHRALFSRRYLGLVFTCAGLKDVHELSPTQVRGDGHGWINLGVTGRK